MSAGLQIPGWLWVATLAGLIGVIILDLVIVDRRPHEFGSKDAARWVVFYVLLATAFAVFVSVYFGIEYGGQFVAGYLTEYSLSVDNLFVFMVIMGSFAVPAVLQHRVLLVGIVIALVLRGVLILVGAKLVESFSGTFYLFGLFLLFTAWQVWTSHEREPHPEGNGFMRWVGSRVPTSSQYDGSRLTTVVAGRRALTPMAMVMLAIGTTDLLFAVDSIPAVFGITSEAYLVFTVNAFALMGLRQLYFLLHGFLTRLKYLNRGLAIILAFIGVKLLLEALHQTTSLDVPTVPIWVSLVVIIAVLAVTAAASLYSTRDGRGPSSPQEE